MQPTKQEKIQYCSKFGIFTNTTFQAHQIVPTCENCGKMNLIVCLKSIDCVLCLPCVEILNDPLCNTINIDNQMKKEYHKNDSDTLSEDDIFNPFDYLYQMGKKDDSNISLKHKPPIFSSHRMMCDIR